jgi:hypothetical protein
MLQIVTSFTFCYNCYDLLQLLHLVTSFTFCYKFSDPMGPGQRGRIREYLGDRGVNREGKFREPNAGQTALADSRNWPTRLRGLLREEDDPRSALSNAVRRCGRPLPVCVAGVPLENHSNNGS